jgi:hypothetical protein
LKSRTTWHIKLIRLAGWTRDKGGEMDRSPEYNGPPFIFSFKNDAKALALPQLNAAANNALLQILTYHSFDTSYDPDKLKGDPSLSKDGQAFFERKGVKEGDTWEYDLASLKKDVLNNPFEGTAVRYKAWVPGKHYAKMQFLRAYESNGLTWAHLIQKSSVPTILDSEVMKDEEGVERTYDEELRRKIRWEIHLPLDGIAPPAQEVKAVQEDMDYIPREKKSLHLAGHMESYFKVQRVEYKR